MIVCRRCSRHHPDGTEFCVCGAYLEFDGERVAEPTQPTTATRPAPGPTTSMPRPAASQAAGEPAPWSGFEPSTRESAQPPGGIDAVLPDAPVHTGPTQPVWVESGGRAGDLPCRRCGTPNGPERVFCRHCGASLTGATDLAPTPPPRKVRWWQRMFGRGRMKVASIDPTAMINRAHGIARGGLSGRTLLFRTGGVMMVLAGAVAFLGPWRRPVLDKAQELVGTDRHEAIDVEPEEVMSTATDPAVPPTSFELQGPGNVVDRYANTAWATRWLNPGDLGFETLPEDDACQGLPSTDSQLVFQFRGLRDLARIDVLGGRPAGDEARTLFMRPRVLELQVDDGPCSYVELDDSGTLASFDFEHDDVETVVVRIVGVYEGEAPGELVEISELVFEE